MAHLLESGKISPVELVEAHLERIETTNETLNAFITVTREEARSAAKQAEKAIRNGEYRGALHGIPIALKDLFNTTGLRTTSGTTVMADFFPKEDATVVAKLKEAGAILLGKLNMNELAFGPTGENLHYGDCLNPWNSSHLSGGSSSGSAATVATGACAATLGTDTGGSIRIPASLCGIVGLKPTYGRVSLYGVTPLCWSMDHVGPMTRTVADCALVLQAIAGHDPMDPTSKDRPVPNYMELLTGSALPLHIGVPQEHVWAPLSEPVRFAVKKALQTFTDLGATVVEISIPLLTESVEISTTIMGAEAIASNGAFLEEHGSELDPRVKERLELGKAISATDYIQAQKVRATLVQQTKDVLQSVDILAFPTCSIAAPQKGVTEINAGDARIPVLHALTRLTRFSNLTGYPAISLPCGLSHDGLPIGLQLVGRPFEEETILHAAYDYQKATEWHLRRPPIG